MNPWIQTYNGEAVDLLAALPESIVLYDVAVGLSRQARFNGHTTTAHAYNVADHSLLCERLCKRSTSATLRLAVLLHDAHEAYCGDISTQMAQAIRSFIAGPVDPIAAIKARLQGAIHGAVGLPRALPADILDAIHKADRLALAAEKRDLMGPEPRAWCDLPDCSDVPTVEPSPGWSSVAGFMQRVRMLVTESGCSPLVSFGL